VHFIDGLLRLRTAELKHTGYGHAHRLVLLCWWPVFKSMAENRADRQPVAQTTTVPKMVTIKLTPPSVLDGQRESAEGRRAPPLSATRQTPHVVRVVAGSCRLVPAAPLPHAIALALGRVITVAWWARRSRSAVVSSSSPAKTVTHSAKLRFVVTTVARRS